MPPRHESRVDGLFGCWPLIGHGVPRRRARVASGAGDRAGGRLGLRSSLTQPLESTGKIFLRHGPVERHALAGAFLKSGAIGDHSLFQALGAALPLTQG